MAQTYAQAGLQTGIHGNRPIPLNSNRTPLSGTGTPPAGGEFGGYDPRSQARQAINTDPGIDLIGYLMGNDGEEDLAADRGQFGMVSSVPNEVAWQREWLNQPIPGERIARATRTNSDVNPYKGDEFSAPGLPIPRPAPPRPDGGITTEILEAPILPSPPRPYDPAQEVMADLALEPTLTNGYEGSGADNTTSMDHGWLWELFNGSDNTKAPDGIGVQPPSGPSIAGRRQAGQSILDVLLGNLGF